LIGRDLRDRPGRWGSAGGSFPLIALLILLALAPASGRDEAVAGGGSEAGSAFGSILLDAYIDDGGRALIVGYLKADSLDDLAFLAGSEVEYDEDLGELYALSDALTSIRDGVTTLEFEADGRWEECHLAFYLPKEATPSAVTASEGLEVSVVEEEGSLVVEAIGYDLDGAEVSIDYLL